MSIFASVYEVIGHTKSSMIHHFIHSFPRFVTGWRFRRQRVREACIRSRRPSVTEVVTDIWNVILFGLRSYLGGLRLRRRHLGVLLKLKVLRSGRFELIFVGHIEGEKISFLKDPLWCKRWTWVNTYSFPDDVDWEKETPLPSRRHSRLDASRQFRSTSSD
jgi:hypothetical protein